MSASDQQARELRDAVRRLLVAHGSLDEARRPCGTPLPTPHAWALLILHESGPMTVSALAERLNIDRTNVSRLCIRMEEGGEVERCPHPDDGRARVIALTAKGAMLAGRVDASSRRHFAGVLDALEGDVTEVVAALEQLSRAIARTTTERT